MQLSLVCVLFDPAIPTSFFNFIQLFYTCFCSFLLYSADSYTQLLSSVIKWKMGGAQNSYPRPSYYAYSNIITPRACARDNVIGFVCRRRRCYPARMRKG